MWYLPNNSDDNYVYRSLKDSKKHDINHDPFDLYEGPSVHSQIDDKN